MEIILVQGERISPVFRKRRCRRPYNGVGDDLLAISVPNKVETDQPEVLQVFVAHIKLKDWVGGPEIL